MECIDGVRCMDNNQENISHQRTQVRSHTHSHAPLAAEAYWSDRPGCIRKLHCSVLHQQAGRNMVNAAVQTDQEVTPHASGQPNSTPGTTHPREIERPCRHSVTPFPDVRYRMVSTSICLPSTDTEMGNPIIGSVCNEVESQTSTICVSCSRAISHGSRCQCHVNELECTVGIRIGGIATISSVTTGAREGPTGPVRMDPHCPTLAPGDLVPTTLRDVGAISTLDTQHSLVTIPALRSYPSRYVQSPATRVEGISDTLCSRDISVDVASHVSRPQRESTLAICEYKWRIFISWCNIQHINPLSATESVVSDFLLHLHTEKHLAISTIAGYQMAIVNTLLATSGAEVGRNPALKSLLRNMEVEWAPSTCHSYQRRKCWARARNACFHAQFQHLAII